MARFSVNKDLGTKFKLLKIILNTNSSSYALEKLLELWEEKHGEIKIPEITDETKE